MRKQVRSPGRALPCAAASLMVIASLLLAGCAKKAPVDDGLAVRRLLDGWHEAASRADIKGYLGPMAKDGVFLGTDPDESWSYEEFAEFVLGYFVRGAGWTYVPSERTVRFSDDGGTAWFFETLRSEKYGRLRGSGVLVRRDGEWKIAQYNMVFTLPNGDTADVVRLLRSNHLRDLPVRPLPAGLYFRPYITSRYLCPGCAQPSHAAVLGVFEDVDDARDRAKDLRVVPLEVGYPLILHTDTLAPRGEEVEGVAVILGLFEDELTAGRWTDAYRELVPEVRVIELMDDDEAYDFLQAKVADGAEGARRVVHVDSAKPVPAVDTTLVNTMLEGDRGSWPDLSKLDPICEIPPGEFFVVEHRILSRYFYFYAPVTCPDGRPALVPWQKTLLEAVIKQDDCGPEISQVVNVECDLPTVRRWRYEAGERRCLAPTSFSSSCSK